MAEVVVLREAVARLVNDGDSVVLEGFTHLIQTRRRLTAPLQGRRGIRLAAASGARNARPRPLRNGLNHDEIKEILLQGAFYCGVPAANPAFAVARSVLALRTLNTRVGYELGYRVVAFRLSGGSGSRSAGPRLPRGLLCLPLRIPSAPR